MENIISNDDLNVDVEAKIAENGQQSRKMIRLEMCVCHLGHGGYHSSRGAKRRKGISDDEVQQN